jgi:hypothetical protein
MIRLLDLLMVDFHDSMKADRRLHSDIHTICGRRLDEDNEMLRTLRLPRSVVALVRAHFDTL